MSFFEELKRRNVVRVAVAYGVAAWVLLQVADLVLENIAAPPWVIQALMLVVGLGFVAALVIAWAYELTPEGIKREADVDRTQSVTSETKLKLDRIIIAFLVVAVAVLLIDRSMSPDGAEMGSEPFSDSTVSQAVSKADQKRGPTPTEAPSDNSIAVLPFANRSLQEEDLFFTDGIHDDLLTQLAKIKDLKVISRTSMMKYRDTEKTIPEIAAELGVATILEGGIQRAGKRVRINAQLINVSNDQHLWAETFDREMTIENIFDIQSEITRHIVTAVRGELTEAETATLNQLPTDSLEAYEAYLQANSFINQPDYNQDNYIQAETWLNKALELDPEYAQAWALTVIVHGQAIWIGYDASPERFVAAKMAVDNAMKFAPGTSETLAAQGEYLYRVENQFAPSVEKFQLAHDLAPGDSETLERLAVAQRRAGLFDESIANFKKGMELDPENSRTATLLTDTLVSISRFEEASPQIDQWMKKFPDAYDLKGQKIRVYMFGYGDLRSARALFNS
ncbi:MAG: TolB-like protein/Tfp pilus assembly protein PilF, partial [Lysobacterales bacterium]